MAYEVNIHPLDLDNDVAIGILLNTAHPGGKLFYQSYTTLDQAKTNLLNLIFTNEGERIMQPTFGCSIKRILFEPLTPSLIQKLDDIIRNKIKEWLPYLKIQKLLIEGEPNVNRVNFQIEFNMRGNDFDRSTVTFHIDTP